MERKHDLVEGEYYHLFSRGVEKRVTFTCARDYERFLLLLLVANQSKTVAIRNLEKKYQGESLVQMYAQEAPKERLTDIVAYTLMPNHFHLVVRARDTAGISRFMLKLLTGYSMYFNTKYERSGPLFVRPYRSRHVDSDEYLRWLLSYVHLNPLELHQVDWKENGVQDMDAAGTFLRNYRYSSFGDTLEERPSRTILTSALPFPLDGYTQLDALLNTFAATPTQDALY